MMPLGFCQHTALGTVHEQTSADVSNAARSAEAESGCGYERAVIEGVGWTEPVSRARRKG
jgi:hypothetical protein